MFGVVAVLIFGVDDEYTESIRSLDERSRKAIQDGAPPSWNNAALGIAFLSALFGNAVMVYTSGIGFLYFLGSTALHGRRGFDGLWQPPLGGITLGSLGIAVTYFYRTPIFNWIYS